jgi:poly(3-hydroxybutyrate) depolymerase
MSERGRVQNTLLVLSSLAALLTTAQAQADEPAVNEMVLKECLVIRPVGRSGRTPLHTDPIEAEIVAGRWKPPSAGDSVQLTNDSKQSWESATAKDGALQHAALRGGYLYWNVKCDTDRVVLLEAAGHSLVYVNGEPRVGDPYSNGIVRLPVLLKKGDNDLLFAVGRGRLNAKLVRPTASAIIDTRDATLPDCIVGNNDKLWGAVVVINADTKTLEHPFLDVSLDGGDPLRNQLPSIAPLSVRKVAFSMTPQAAKSNKPAVQLELRAANEGKEPLDTAKVNINQKSPDELRQNTFVSSIDGSVQYYAVQPALPVADANKAKFMDGPALFLTLHGAGVEGRGQAAAYGRKEGGYIVAPTNRRPYGFDWEDWGRLDAMEVLDLAQKEFKTDPLRTYLTGHSMGGHGTWHVGVTFPDRFAAIAPSAGWISFATYAGGMGRRENPTPMEAMLARAGLPNETLTLKQNYANLGIFVLHGDADDNVPVDQARKMRKELANFHPDFAYHEQPGAGHWWGNACVDWPPLFEFLLEHKLPDPKSMPKVDFVTASPAVSATCHWATIEAQVKPFEPSSMQLRYDSKSRRFSGKTENVERLSLDLAHLKPGEPFHVELDGTKIELSDWPEKVTRLWLRRNGDKWEVGGRPDPSVKNPQRGGPFKEAFRNRVVFVYGTKGTAAETAWAFAKARLDAETLWYRGNSSIDVIADMDFDPKKDTDRNVIVYGNSDSHARWQELLGDSPVQVKRGSVTIDDRKEAGEDLACLFVRPRPGSHTASVGVVGGTGLSGMRLTDRMPYFVSGVAYPDCIVVDAQSLTKGINGVRVAGFFGNNWRVPEGDFVWK